MADRRPGGAARGRPRGAYAAAGSGAVGPRRRRAARRTPRAGLQYRALDPAARGPGDQAGNGRDVSPGPRLAPPGHARLDPAAAGQTREGAARARDPTLRDPTLDDDALACGKKNA